MITNFTNYKKISNYRLSEGLTPVFKHLRALNGLSVPILQKDISATYEYLEYVSLDRRNKTIPASIGQIMTLIELPIKLNRTPVFNEELLEVKLEDVMQFVKADEFPVVRNLPKLSRINYEYLDAYRLIYSNNSSEPGSDIDSIPKDLTYSSINQFNKIRSLILKSNPSPYEYHDVTSDTGYAGFIASSFNVFSNDSIDNFPSNMSIALEYNDITVFNAAFNSIRLIQHKLSTIDANIIENISNAYMSLDFIKGLDESGVVINSAVKDKLDHLTKIDHNYLSSIYSTMLMFQTDEYKYMCNMYGLVELYATINPNTPNYFELMTTTDVETASNAINAAYDNTDWSVQFSSTSKIVFSKENMENLNQMKVIVDNKIDLNVPENLQIEIELIKTVTDIIEIMNSLKTHNKSFTSLLHMSIFEELSIDLSAISIKLDKLYTTRSLLSTKIDFGYFSTAIFDNLSELVLELSNIINKLRTSGKAVNSIDILESIDAMNQLLLTNIPTTENLSIEMPAYNSMKILSIIEYLSNFFGYKSQIDACYLEIPVILNVVALYNTNVNNYINLKNSRIYIAMSAVNIMQHISTIPTFDKLYSVYDQLNSLDEYIDGDNTIIPDVFINDHDIIEIIDSLKSVLANDMYNLRASLDKYDIILPDDVSQLSAALSDYNLLAKNNRDLQLLNAVKKINSTIVLYNQSLTISPISIREIDLKNIHASKKLINNIKSDVIKFTKNEFLDYVQFCGTYRSAYIRMNDWINSIISPYSSKIGFHASNSTELIDINDLSELLQLNNACEYVIKPLNITINKYNRYNNQIFTSIQMLIDNEILINNGKNISFNNLTLPISDIGNLLTKLQKNGAIQVKSRLYKMLHLNFEDMLSDFTVFLDYSRYHVNTDVPQMEGEISKYNIINRLNDFANVTNSKYTDPIINVAIYKDLFGLGKELGGHILKLAPNITKLANKLAVDKESTTISEKGTGKDVITKDITIAEALHAVDFVIKPIVDYTSPPLNIGLPLMYGIEDLTKDTITKYINKIEPALAVDSFVNPPFTSNIFSVESYVNPKRNLLVGRHAIDPASSSVLAHYNGTNHLLKNITNTYIVDAVGLGVSKLKYIGVSEINKQGGEYNFRIDDFCTVSPSGAGYVCSIIKSGTFEDVNGTPVRIFDYYPCEYIDSVTCRVIANDICEVYQYSSKYKYIKYESMNGSGIGLFGSYNAGPNHYKLGEFTIMINQYNQLTGFAKGGMEEIDPPEYPPEDYIPEYRRFTQYKYLTSESEDFLKVLEEMPYPVPMYYGYDGEAQGERIFRYTADGQLGYLIVGKYYYNSRAMYLKGVHIQATNNTNQAAADAAEIENMKPNYWVPQTVANTSVAPGIPYPDIANDEFPRFRNDSAYGVKVSSSTRSLKLMNGNTIIANRIDSFSHTLPEYFFAIKSEINPAQYVLITPHMLANDDPLKISILSTYSAYDMLQFEKHINIVANSFGSHYSELELYPVIGSFVGVSQFYSINNTITLMDTLNTHTGVIADKTFRRLINYEGETIGIMHPNGYDYILLGDLIKIYDIDITAELYNIYYTK